MFSIGARLRLTQSHRVFRRNKTLTQNSILWTVKISLKVITFIR